MHYTIINRTNNRYGQQYMNSQSRQWCQYLPNDFYYFGNSNTPPIQNILWFFLLPLCSISQVLYSAPLPQQPHDSSSGSEFFMPLMCQTFCMLKRIDIPSSIQRVTIQFNPTFNQSGSQTFCAFVFVSVHHTHIIIIIIIIMCYQAYNSFAFNLSIVSLSVQPCIM